MVEALFGELSVEQVREASSAWGTSDLLAAFDRYRDYRTAAEWNGLVRVCEALAVVGWGEREPVEAFAERWINGSFYTQLRNRQFEVVLGSDQRWDKQGNSFVLADDASSLSDGAGERDDVGRGVGAGKSDSAGRSNGAGDHVVVGAATGLASQRIPLASSPVRLVRSSGCQVEAKPFAEEVVRLRELLDRRLAKPYGPGFGSLGIRLHFSHPASGRAPGAEYFHEVIGAVSVPGAKAYVRPRLEVGRFSLHRGELVCTAVRHYTDAEARADLAEQKRGFAEDFDAALDDLARRLRRRAPGYRIADLRADAAEALSEWLRKP
ncbi:hypothetical protein [Actinoplanes sp. RD1]|uniref:hypothetical protein n=1 Tax=Actinoplanes sp. RD1 TaxID=3064538 RepID=UPI00274234B4|nr:hypothetical protein [Actinoplanes sp. RD1]